MHMMSKPIVISLLLFGLVPNTIQAFVGEEHKFISRTGLLLALEYCKQSPDCNIDQQGQLQLAAFLDIHSRLEYGMLVSSIDYRINPLQILASPGSQQELPHAPLLLDKRLIELLTNPGAPFLRAATVNDTHFQGELIAGIRNWHSYATTIAAGNTNEAPNLFAGLLINSFADHFLQDFFAPGHIVTPRFGLHDAVALGMHNLYNILGTNFVVDQALFSKDLEPLLSTFIATTTAGSDEIREAAEELRNGRAVPLWGDGDLFRSPCQRLLMILVEARSVLDILASYYHRTPVNSFEAVGWKPMYISTKPIRLHHATAYLPYGKHEHGPQTEGLLVFPTIVGVSLGSEVITSADTSTRTVIELEQLVFGLPPNKFDLNSTDGDSAKPAYFRDRQWGVTLGYSYAYNDEEVAHGPKVRLIRAFPLLHLQVSADFARKKYVSSPREEQEWTYGARVQTGFSLLQFDLGVARDFTYKESDRIFDKTVVIRFGISLMGPITSVPGVRKIEQSVLRQRRRSKDPTTCNPKKAG